MRGLVYHAGTIRSRYSNESGTIFTEIRGFYMTDSPENNACDLIAKLNFLPQVHTFRTLIRRVHIIQDPKIP
jgi:hypothetical protein